MWTDRDISLRKVRRKWQSDGTKNLLVASLETIFRKFLWRRVYSKLSKNGYITTIHREELVQRAQRLYSFQSGLTTEPENSIKEPFVAELDGGYILSETGLGVTKNGDYIVETVTAPESETGVMACLSRQMFESDPRLTFDVLRRNLDTVRTRAKPIKAAVPLIARHPNYYHWLIETVPKIRYVREFETTTGQKATYLVPSDRPSWVKQTLELLGIPDSKIEWITAPVYYAQPLIIPSFPLKSSSPHYSAEDYKWLQNQFLKQNRIKNEGANVYISRSNAISRQVINEDEVMDLLSKYGFQKYNLENQSLEQNAALFNEANIVVGAHGAGLTDIVFCNNTSVVELFGSRVKPPYRRIAAELGLEYRELHCKPVSTDIYVNTTELESIITNLID